MSDTVVVTEVSATLVEVVTMGPVGPAGQQGLQGLTGATGPQGPIGETGPAGSTGQSAYQSAVAAGFVGTEVAWLLSLVGATGAQGPQGNVGATGPSGPTGATGRGIASVVRTSGTGAPGTTDTYTITYSDATASAFSVYNGANGANGAGAGDMLTSAYDTNADGKVNAADAADAVPWAGVTGKPATFAPSAHDHAIADVTGLQVALDGKQSTLVSGTDIKTLNGVSLLGSGGVEVGYLNIPQNSQSAAYTCALSDAGKHILHPSADTTARTFTIPANASVAFEIGTAITFVNQVSAGVVTIAITSDTMRLAGAGTTGSRTLAANGVATAIKLTATEWIISGTGLT